MVDESWLRWLCSISRCPLGLGVKTGGAAGEGPGTALQASGVAALIN
jgi:hypothetical protein